MTICLNLTLVRIIQGMRIISHISLSYLDPYLDILLSVGNTPENSLQRKVCCAFQMQLMRIMNLDCQNIK